MLAEDWQPKFIKRTIVSYSSDSLPVKVFGTL